LHASVIHPTTLFQTAKGGRHDSEPALPNNLLDDRRPLAVFQTNGPVRFLHPGHAMAGDSLKQPIFGPGFRVEIAAFDANLVAMNM
jgi:hypothetical protein